MKNKPLDTQDWRTRWVQLGDCDSAIMHRVSSDVRENDNEYVVVNYTGTTVCGLKNDFLIMPGIFSRMGATRCKRCCQILGIPQGEGNPYNAGIPETEIDKIHLDK